MTLSELIALMENGRSHEDMLDSIRKYKEYYYGMAQSGKVLAYIASIGKLSLFRNLAKDTTSPLYSAADAAIVTLETREGFDFSSPATSSLMEAFVLAGVLKASEAESIRKIAQSCKYPFENITMWQMLQVRRPKDCVESASNIVTAQATRKNHEVVAIVTGDVPTDTAIRIQARHKHGDVYGQWKIAGVIGGVNKEGVYDVDISGEYLKEGTEIRALCPYNLTMSITATVV